jgi:hypothetical protein
MQREFPLPPCGALSWADRAQLTADPCRWKYLEAGVSRIMINLQEGIDMHTVSISIH